MKVKFASALFDSSGYSEASRNYLCALATQDLELTAQTVKFERWKTEFNDYEARLQQYVNKDIGKPDVQIIHMTPENYPKYRDNSIKKNIGYTTWEADRLPDIWVKLCNTMDAIWTTSSWNVEVFKQSGIKCPIECVPHAIDLPSMLARPEQQIAWDVKIPEDKFVFYCISQWSERKNFAGLLRAFFSEFSTQDNVVLVVKTYLEDHNPSERDMIRQEIQRIRTSMFLTNAPPVIFIGGALSSEQIAYIHNRGHCLVAPVRAEGFGLTLFESLAFNKPVITTGYGGQCDFITNDTGYLIDYTMTPVCNMKSNLYNGRMMWAEPDLAHLKKLMRRVYENPDEAREKASRGKQMLEKYSWENIGKLMVEKLREIV